MLINTVILMLRDALPIALLMSFLLLAFRLQRQTLVVLLLSTVITTAVLVLLRNSVSDTFDGAGYEWLTVALLLIAYLFALLSLDFRAYRSAAIIAAVPVISLHLADFMLYLFAFGSHSERLPGILVGSVLGSGISLSLAMLLVVLLSPYRTTLAMKSLWVLFMAAQASGAIPLLQQTGVIDESAALWDSSAIISDASEYGHLLKAMLGYESQPDLPYLLTWLTLVVLGQCMVLRHHFLLRSSPEGASS